MYRGEKLLWKLSSMKSAFVGGSTFWVVFLAGGKNLRLLNVFLLLACSVTNSAKIYEFACSEEGPIKNGADKAFFTVDHFECQQAVSALYCVGEIWRSLRRRWRESALMRRTEPPPAIVRPSGVTSYMTKENRNLSQHHVPVGKVCRKVCSTRHAARLLKVPPAQIAELSASKRCLRRPVFWVDVQEALWINEEAVWEGSSVSLCALEAAEEMDRTCRIMRAQGSAISTLQRRDILQQVCRLLSPRWPARHSQNLHFQQPSNVPPSPVENPSWRSTTARQSQTHWCSWAFFGVHAGFAIHPTHEKWSGDWSNVWSLSLITYW